MRSFEMDRAAPTSDISIVACWLPRADRSARRAFLIAGVGDRRGRRLDDRARGAPLVRDWAPLGYILAGYFLSGYLFAAPSLSIEAWLMAWDRRLLGDPATRFVGWPRPLVAGLELIYMGCFLLIPAGAGDCSC